MNIYMLEALKEAKKYGDVPVGAVIVKNGKIIARAHNKREIKKNVIMHAEIIALNKACKKLRTWHLDDCEIYITLEPCTMCYGAIEQSRIKKIVCGLENEKFGYFNKDHSKSKITFISGILKKDCEKILRDFFIKKR